jgi:hypothetical protein
VSSAIFFGPNLSFGYAVEEMRTLPGLIFSLCCLLFWPAAFAGTEPSSATPANLAVPSGQTLALVLTAKGVQVYECRQVPDSPGKFEWVFKAPEADLFDAKGQKVGRHFAGPTWVLTDGGMVTGHLKSKADAPDGKGVPWLLLDAVQASGTTMSKVQSIQRVDTVGGKAPTDPPDAKELGKEARVAYTATYKFYAAEP